MRDTLTTAWLNGPPRIRLAAPTGCVWGEGGLPKIKYFNQVYCHIHLNLVANPSVLIMFF
jgi:hypothetical protein